MTTEEPSGKEGVESNDKNKNELRARWEEIRMTVCANGVVNVQNLSHGEDAKNHIHSVMLDGATAVRCSCPHHVHRGARCKHMISVENRPLVVSSATAAADSYALVATDGGKRQ